jgi:hypothetical protein
MYPEAFNLWVIAERVACRHLQQFTTNVWARTVGDWYVRMFCHIKMYHWQLEHECGTCMMVLQHILAVLCNMFLITSIMANGQV